MKKKKMETCYRELYCCQNNYFRVHEFVLVTANRTKSYDYLFCIASQYDYNYQLIRSSAFWFINFNKFLFIMSSHSRTNILIYHCRFSKPTSDFSQLKN